jgi:benzoyl-CoA reductase/2-hydroxyglutaryl-CoA dehydratase subunit BcrC/BadD/HgdB
LIFSDQNLCYYPATEVDVPTFSEDLISISSRSEIIQTQLQRGGKVAAVLPIHYPRALFRAFDILPVELWGPPNVASFEGGTHVQPYICSIVRNAISFLQSGGLELVDLVVVPHACDSLQGLGSILLDFIQPHQSVLPLYMPRSTDEGAIRFFANELMTLSNQLEKLTGRSPSEETLMKCIEQDEIADGFLIKLVNQRDQLDLSDLSFFQVLRSREYLPAEEFSEHARSILDQSSQPNRQGIPILLSGIVPEPMSIFQAIEELGGMVVADDLACCGRRLYPPGTQNEPYRRMAERILSGPPDWNHGSPIQARLLHLKEKMIWSGARGVLFYNVKFCEPELFDLPDLRRELQAAGFPSVLIEVDINDSLSSQVLTRIEAFLEMLA